MPIEVNAVNEQNMLTEPIVTDWINVFYNPTNKKFKASLTSNVSNNDEMMLLKDIVEKVKEKSPFRKNKEETQTYVKFGLSKKLKIYDESKKEIKPELEEIFKSNDARIVFTASIYSVAGVDGICFTANQIQLRPKIDKFQDCMF